MMTPSRASSRAPSRTELADAFCSLGQRGSSFKNNARACFLASWRPTRSRREAQLEPLIKTPASKREGSRGPKTKQVAGGGRFLAQPAAEATARRPQTLGPEPKRQNLAFQIGAAYKPGSCLQTLEFKGDASSPVWKSVVGCSGLPACLPVHRKRAVTGRREAGQTKA